MALRVRTLWTGGRGAPYLSTHIFEGTGATAAGDANASVGQFWSDIDTVVSDELSWGTETEVEEFDPTTGNITTFHPVTAATGSGADTNARATRAAQGLIRWRTGVYVLGRELRGRTFVPGPTTSSVFADGRLTATYQNTLATAATALWTVLVPNLAIWSPSHGQLAEVNASSVWAEFAVLRSRRD